MTEYTILWTSPDGNHDKAFREGEVSAFACYIASLQTLPDGSSVALFKDNRFMCRAKVQK